MIKLFAHRGFVDNDISQNSLKALKNAYLKGFRAIEFDIWFLNNQLLLSHDKPDIDKIKELAVFKDYFLYQNEMEYWMDFKNLDEKNVNLALKMVKNDLNEAKIDLNRVFFAPFITDYDLAIKIFEEIRMVFGGEVKIIAVCEELKEKGDDVLLSRFLKDNQIKYLSIFYKLVDESLLKMLDGVEIFAWTVNDKEEIRSLNKIGVKNFATDFILPS